MNDRTQSVFKPKDSFAPIPQFLLCRILGNDLPPRHGRGQTLRNLDFTLRHEKRFPELHKHWVLNRIVDEHLSETLKAMLREHGYEPTVIPFEQSNFAKLAPNFEHFSEQDFTSFLSGVLVDDYKFTLTLDHAFHEQNRYVMNVNSARNVALASNFRQARWIMPWDGNCFLHESAWHELVTCARDAESEKFIVVPMERIIDNSMLLSTDVRFAALEEPQLIFRSDVLDRFDENLRYGRYSKVEMLRRIGFPGVWDAWDYQPWENKRWFHANDAGRWSRAGWVARLHSGRDEYDEDPTIQGIRKRSNARRTAVRNFIVGVESRTAEMANKFGEGIVYRAAQNDLPTDSMLVRQARREAIAAAETALGAHLFSVVDKPQSGPSGDKRDYYSVAPFWWPDPAKAAGLPFLRRDGERNPEADLDCASSLRFDSTHLQHVFDNVTALGLAANITGNAKYAERAGLMIEKWFVDPRSAMVPNLAYAQVRRGHDRREAAGHGIIDAKDIYYLLDAVRIVSAMSGMQPKVLTGFNAWCAAYLAWLKNSPQGRLEASARNNHGTCYELQVLSLSAYLRNYDEVVQSINRCRARIAQQFTSTGEQPAEDSRRNSLHYNLFNLQCWMTLDHMASCLGFRLLRGAKPVWLALEKTVANYRQFRNLVADVEMDLPSRRAILPTRLLPLLAMAETQSVGFADVVCGPIELVSATTLHPYAGVAPFWPLMLNRSEVRDG